MITQAKLSDSFRLTELTMRSKSYWNYSTEQLEKWREDLTISPEYIEKNLVYLLTYDDNLIGYYSFYAENKSDIHLDNMFLEPKHIGKGYGHVLMTDFISRVKNLGAISVNLFSEPSAENFYLKYGFISIGKKETSIKNRYLPIMKLELI